MAGTKFADAQKSERKQAAAAVRELAEGILEMNGYGTRGYAAPGAVEFQPKGRAASIEVSRDGKGALKVVNGWYMVPRDCDKEGFSLSSTVFEAGPDGKVRRFVMSDWMPCLTEEYDRLVSERKRKLLGEAKRGSVVE